MEKIPNKERRYIIQAMSLMSQLAITVIVCVFLGVFLGRFIDNRLGTSPWFLLAFSFLGCGAALKAMIDVAKKF
jgi:F0F1-type ATP synthase assembly protein I